MMDNLKEILEANAGTLGLTDFTAMRTPDGVYQISFKHNGAHKQGVADPARLPGNATNVQKHEFAAAELRRLVG